MPGTGAAAANNGDWVAYNPTMTGVGWAFGDAVVDAAFTRLGKLVFFRIAITWGATSTYGTATPVFTLPTPMKDYSAGSGTSFGLSIGLNVFWWDAWFPSNLGVQPALRGANGAGSGLPTGTQPFAWKSGDRLGLAGWYQEA